MAPKTSNPIVLIIDRDHQDIGPLAINRFGCDDRRKHNGH
jgi:hypothetical protein